MKKSKNGKAASKKEEKIRLSASKIKTLQLCSWTYFCKYILKLPDKSNDGAKRGTITHLILECFVNKRHRKHFDIIEAANGDIHMSKPVIRLVQKHAKILGVDDKDNIELIYKMIWSGMSHDFFCKGCEKLEAENNFFLEADNYIINGFIDKTATYKNKTVIYDYKTSKQKFEGKDLTDNVQSTMYSLATFKETGKIPEVKFLFLKPEFMDDPVAQPKTCSEDSLKGFEHYLKDTAAFMQRFDEKAAMQDFAADKPYGEGFTGPVMCGRAKFAGQLKKDGNPMWFCSLKFGFIYYALKDGAGKVIKTAFEEIDLEKYKNSDLKIVKMEYNGCPKFKNRTVNKNFKNKKDYLDDLFKF